MPIAITKVVKDTFGSVFSNTKYCICVSSLRHCMAVTEQAMPSFSHYAWSPAVKPVCRTCLLSNVLQPIIDSSFFDLEGLPLSQRLQKWDITYYRTRSTILQNFSPIVQTVYKICVTNVFHPLALILTPQDHPRSNVTVPIESRGSYV